MPIQPFVTILAVVVGAAMSFLGTLALERQRHRTDASKRWDELRLQAYSKYLSSVQLVVAATRTIVLAPTTEDVDGRDDGREKAQAELDAAHVRRAVGTEDLRLLASPELVEAAHLLNLSVWQLQDFARGEVDWDEAIWRQCYEIYLTRLFEFQKGVRDELRIPGEIPQAPRPPDWFFRRRAGQS